MKKRLLSILLALSMVLALLSGTAWADEAEDVPTSGTCGDNLTWTLDGAGTLTISGTGYMRGFSIVSGAPWYDLLDSIKSVVIERGVTSIGDCAFYGMSELVSIKIPSGVTSIGDSAFSECSSLTSIDIPADVETIGNSAFIDCYSLSRVGLVPGITSIDDFAFSGCNNLSSINIPSSVTSIGESAFYACSSLTSMVIPTGITYIEPSTFHGCTSLTSVVLPSSIICIGALAFCDCTGLTDVYFEGDASEWDSIEISSYWDGNECLINATLHYGELESKKVSGILRSTEAGDILWECSYQVGSDDTPRNGRIDITMAHGSDKVDELYLYNGSGAAQFPWELEPYNIPKSAITKVVITGPLGGPCLRVAANSFQGYDKLQTLVLDQVSGIDSYAFEGCTSLKDVTRWGLDEDLAHIGKGAFKNCTSLAEMSFSGITTIGDEAFQNTPLGEIQLHKGITEIGSNAFADCEDVLICCYEGSYAHQYAQENNIPFKLIEIEPTDTSIKPTQITFNLGLAGPIDMLFDWGWELFETSTSTYNDQLSIASLALSAAAEHSQENAKDLLRALGFSRVSLKSENYGHSWEDIWYPGVVFGHQVINDQHYFAIVVRGTDGSEPEDILTDITAGGFISSAQNIYGQFYEYIQATCNLDVNEIKGKCKFLLTGHSLGAATANVLAKKLSDDFGVSNVFNYNFAPPRSIDSLTDILNIGKYDNIFNIINIEDGVTYLPPSDLLFDRYGHDIRFHRVLTPAFYGFFEQLTGRSFNKGILGIGADSAHDTAVYMSFVLSKRNSGPIRVLRCACPVDIEMYDSSGMLVGSVTNNIAKNTEEEKVFIHVENDIKYIYILADDDYTLKIMGTDDGTMTYDVQDIEMSDGQTVGEKVFENVTLTSGKIMTSTVSVENVIDVPLYVLGDDDQPEFKVLPDGQGTEIPLNTIAVIFDANGGFVSTASMQTRADGKLTSWPTPTRTGYTFNGWFTSASGGASLATDTVFAKDTTVYAQWTAVSVNPDPTPGPNNPVGPTNPGSSWNDYTPPTTYTITTPTTPNGTVVVSPKSASKGSTVTITATPDTGYQLTTLTVTDNNGKEVSLTDKGSGAYAFTMPSSKVSINAVFQLIKTPWSNPFTDVSTGAWYYDAVKFVSENGLMNGIGNSLFAPEANLSRGMLTQILYNKEGQPAVTDNSTFTDVNPGAWYSVAVSWASEKGIVGGYSNGLFGPNDNITREQLAVMLWRYAGKPVPPNLLLNFTDANLVSDYAIDAMRWAVDKGIINGKGNGILDPGGYATRAEAAQMLKNYLIQ